MLTMMLDQLREEWDKDCVWNETEPDKAALNIPQLHSKYVNQIHEHNIHLRMAEFKRAKMLKLRTHYYQGKLSKEELEARNWPPFQFVLKSDLKLYLDADDELMKLDSQCLLHEECKAFCREVINQINQRTWHIKHVVEWAQFIAGQ